VSELRKGSGMKMTISYREFLKSLLLGARMLDEVRPFLKVEEMLWSQWAFDDKGAHYIQPEERGKANPAFRPEGVTLQ